MGGSDGADIATYAAILVSFTASIVNDTYINTFADTLYSLIVCKPRYPQTSMCNTNHQACSTNFTKWL